ncbi:unnamed protein product [Amoebophrya sp. A120]|nr:unnamed protein product [Amoebophrya sp. A120]|eukprot:GSA120T00002827001.1
MEADGGKKGPGPILSARSPRGARAVSGHAEIPEAAGEMCQRDSGTRVRNQRRRRRAPVPPRDEHRAPEEVRGLGVRGALGLTFAVVSRTDGRAGPVFHLGRACLRSHGEERTAVLPAPAWMEFLRLPGKAVGKFLDSPAVSALTSNLVAPPRDHSKAQRNYLRRCLPACGGSSPGRNLIYAVPDGAGESNLRAC